MPNSARTLCLAHAIVAIASTLSAQTQLAEIGKALFPTDTRSAQAVAIGDVDGDGIADLCFGMPGRCALLLGEGDAHFVPASLPSSNGDTRAVALFDADGDQDLDLLLGNAPLTGEDGQDQLLLNDGQGGFFDATATHLPADNDATQALAVGDVDGDGDVDLVVGLGDSTGLVHDRLLVNDGSGHFSDATPAALIAAPGFTAALVLGDLDLDGDLDLVAARGGFAGTGEPDRLFLNDGSGGFTDASTTHLPGDSAATPGLALADCDADGDLDLAIVDSSLTQPGGGRLLVNDGSGRFVNSTAWSPGAMRATAIAARDVDADGRVDLVVSGYGEPTQVWLAGSQGTFARGSLFPAEAPLVRAQALVDLDNDALPDLLQLTSEGAWLWINRGFSRFYDSRTCMRAPVGGLRTASSCTLDADGDGDLDVVLVRADLDQGFRLELWRNDGRGSFYGGIIPLPTSLATPRAVVAADIDRDGDADLVLATAGQDLLLHNDGLGSFADATASLPVTEGDTQTLVIGDLDGDQDADVLLADRDSSGGSLLVLWRNDGNAGLVADPTATITSPYDIQALLLLDVDGDTDLDAILGNGSGTQGQPEELLRNDGSGRLLLEPQSMPAFADSTVGLAAADLDGDGDLDLVAANGDAGGPTAQAAQLYLNNGIGLFVAATSTALSPPVLDTASVAAGDLDQDGKLDLLFGSFGPAPLQFYAGAGDGTFADASATRTPARALDARILQLFDVDLDGDLDALAGHDDLTLLTNLHRQATTPRLARSGFAWTLELWSEPGYGTGSHLAVTALSLGGLQPAIPLPPYGAFHLDPTLLIVLPGLPIPAQAPLSLTFTLPNLLPSLSGQSLWAQAMVIPGSQSSTWRLTNATTDLVIR